MDKYRLPLIIFLIIHCFLSCDMALAVDISPHLDFVKKNDRIMAVVEYRISDGYHAYARGSQGTGKPTELDFVLEGTGRMPVIYPAGEKTADTFNPAKKVEIYAGQVTLFVPLPDAVSGDGYVARLDMLLCSNRNCVPYKHTFSGVVPGKISHIEETPYKEAFAALQSDPSRDPEKILVEEGTLPPPRQGQPEESTEIQIREKGEPLKGDEAPSTDDSSHYPTFDPRYVEEDGEVYSLGQGVLLGVLAGLILNVMPCVLPVLAFKVGSLLALGGATDARRLREFRIHNFCFAAGILTLFTLLALLLGAADRMWGQLYQNQTLLLLMLLLVFLMGLSMLGVFTLPTFDLRLGRESRNPALKSYLTGIVSTFLATPCSGPLLGGVLAWAFTQPLPVQMIIFWSVGAGMGLPYIILGLWPGTAKFLPRPGNWMMTFERLLGFLLLATSLYLLSILPQNKHLHILSVLLAASVGAWLWGEFCGLGASRVRRWGGGFLGCVILGFSVWWILKPAAPEPVWQNFSASAFEEELGKRDLILEFTADWCPNCKFLEATVLTAANLDAWQKRYPATLVRVDLTRSNPAAEKLLASLGSKSIPFTALFSRGGKSRSPVVLRDLYDADTMRKALQKAFN